MSKKITFTAVNTAALVVLSSLFASSVFAAGDYSSITSAISTEQTSITGVVFGVAGVLAAIYAAMKGASLALRAIRGH